MFTARLDVLRRGGDGAGFSATAELARDTASSVFPGHVDAHLLAFTHYCAGTELDLNTDEGAARRVWEACTTGGEGGADKGECCAHIAEAHVAHAEFLTVWRRLGQVDAARGVFKRCYARANMESLAAGGSTAAGRARRRGEGQGGEHGHGGGAGGGVPRVAAPGARGGHGGNVRGGGRQGGHAAAGAGGRGGGGRHPQGARPRAWSSTQRRYRSPRGRLEVGNSYLADDCT